MSSTGAVWEERALSCFPARGPASTARASGPSAQGEASMLCTCSSRRHGLPLAGLTQWWGKPVCEPVLSGRKEQKAACHGGGPCSFVASYRDGAPEAPESSQPAGQSVPGQFAPPVFSPELLVLCNPCPFSSPLTVG